MAKLVGLLEFGKMLVQNDSFNIESTRIRLTPNTVRNVTNFFNKQTHNKARHQRSEGLMFLHF